MAINTQHRQGQNFHARLTLSSHIHSLGGAGCDCQYASIMETSAELTLSLNRKKRDHDCDEHRDFDTTKEYLDPSINLEGYVRTTSTQPVSESYLNSKRVYANQNKWKEKIDDAAVNLPVILHSRPKVKQRRRRGNESRERNRVREPAQVSSTTANRLRTKDNPPVRNTNRNPQLNVNKLADINRHGTRNRPNAQQLGNTLHHRPGL